MGKENGSKRTQGIRNAVRVSVGVLFALVFAGILILHIVLLFTGGLTAVDFWEMPATLSISIGLGLCGLGLVTQRARVALASSGCGLVISGLSLTTFCVMGYLTRGAWFPMYDWVIDSFAVNMVTSIGLLALGLHLLWLALRCPSPTNGDASQIPNLRPGPTRKAFLLTALLVGGTFFVVCYIFMPPSPDDTVQRFMEASKKNDLAMMKTCVDSVSSICSMVWSGTMRDCMI